MSYDEIVDPALGLSMDYDYGHIQGLSRKFLIAVAQGKVDAKALLIRELTSRGYDTEGNWAGLREESVRGPVKRTGRARK